MGRLKGSLKNSNGKDKKASKKRKKDANTELFKRDSILNYEEERIEIDNSEGKTKRKGGKRKEVENVDAGEADQTREVEDANRSKELLTRKKRDNLRKKKRKGEAKNIAVVGQYDQRETEDEDGFVKPNDDGAADWTPIIAERDMDDSIRQSKTVTDTKTRKSKKSKKKRKEHDMEKEDSTVPEKREEAIQGEVYSISSGDEDSSKGMKKWLLQYHQSRPGLKVLQQRIDEFMIDHEEKIEQERKEREARIAEEGWTVVKQHKGRKKSADAESGITVGSVAQAVVEDQTNKKKRKEVGLNFYRFQIKDAQRNEILTLQSKFEQDKKRIQQLRAARKFRPY
uniref:Ribosomal RNA-processing protein 7 C-terminal domain-containing protein n=2 Tax=Rhizophora mucronata TaxID=61149 RepID=A0A2P2JML8_RHIMU